MKIAILTNLYPPFVRGGAEYLTHQVVQELVRQGHRVVVITTVPWKSVKAFKPELRDEGGVRVYRFFPVNLYHYLSASRAPYWLRFVWQLVNMFNFQAARVVKRILIAEQPELTVSANLMGISFLIPRVLAGLGLPHIHILHDVQLLHPSGLFMLGRSGSGASARLYQLGTRWLFGPVGTVVSPSHWLMDEHKRRGMFARAKAVTLPNPVPLTQVEPAIKTTKTPLKLLYVGQLEQHKGLTWLLQVMQKMPRRDFELHIYALGQRPALQEVRQMVKNDSRLVLHDLPSQREIDEAYACSHLVIVPSLCYENSPVAIPRAFSAGTPVLAAGLGGIPELVRTGETGWLFTAGAGDDLISKLNWCLDHPGELLKAGLGASREFESRTLASYVHELLKLPAGG